MQAHLPCLSQECLFSLGVFFQEEVRLFSLHAGLVEILPGRGQARLCVHQALAGSLQLLGGVLQLGL